MFKYGIVVGVTSLFCINSDTESNHFELNDLFFCVFQLHSWLENVFVTEPVPQFEIGPETIEFLSEFMDVSRRSEDYGRNLIDDLERKALEYAAESSFQFSFELCAPLLLMNASKIVVN